MLRKRLGIIQSVLVIAGSLAGFQLGAAAATPECAREYCGTDVSGCTPLNVFDPALCCKDFDGDGVYHCVNCTRQWYQCDLAVAKGPGFNCGNPGAECQ